MAATPHGSAASRRVVVGVDRSLSARIALEHAARRTGPDGCLIVAHVMTPLREAIARAMGGVAHDRHAAGQQLVDQLAGDAGVRTETRVVDGHPAECLARLARDSEADEIVVGSRGMGRLAAAVGSVSHALLAHAAHPIVVVPRAAADHRRGARRDGRTVIVGYDGSPPARAALVYAARWATDGERVIAVHASQPASEWLRLPSYDRAVAAYEEQGRKLLDSLEQDARLLGIEVATSLLEGPPARALVAAADAAGADEIIVGSRGFGRVRGVLGSVSHAVLHQADRPVVVIPADAAATGGPPD